MAEKRPFLGCNASDISPQEPPFAFHVSAETYSTGRNDQVSRHSAELL